jgi:hypothetical protein
MKTAFRRLLAAAHALVLSSALSACMLTGGDTLVAPGGAEDFPNTVETLGKIAVSDISSSADWQQVQEITLPEVPDLSGLGSLQVSQPQAKFAVLGKASVDTLNLTLWRIDSTKVLDAYLNDRLTAYALDSTGDRVRRDTVLCKYIGDSVIRLSSVSLLNILKTIQDDPGGNLLPYDYRGAVEWKATGIRQTYRLRNMDQLGEMDLAEYATVTPQTDGGTLRKWVQIYGPDGAYLNPAAAPEKYELLRRGPAKDTLEWTQVLDIDSDRKLWDGNARGMVAINVHVRNPASQPELARMHVSMRADFLHGTTAAGDSLKQLYFHEQRWLRRGGVVNFTFQGVGGPGDLSPNGAARMTVDTVFALADSMIKYTAVYNLKLGEFTDRMQDHKLLGYGIVKYWRRGPVFNTVSVFAPAAPVPMGQAGFEGQMSSTAAYANGDTVTTTGSIGSAGFNLTVQQVKQGAKETFTVLLDAAGNLLEITPVPADATSTAKRAPRP